VLDWINGLSNRWNPTIESDEHQTHTSEPAFYGIGIAKGLARTWGKPEAVIEVTDIEGETEPTSSAEKFASCILAENIGIGDTIHNQGQSLTLVVPIFD
jgi:hypothetical protein